MKKFIGHLTTINKHRLMVIRHCLKCGIFFQGLFHDLSKFSFEEFWTGVKFYQGNRSPNEAERAVYGFSKAWMHHKGRNKHHFEYWTDYNPETKQLEPVKMPKKYVAEMFCDRVAASKIYMKKKYTDKAPLDYFLNGKKAQRLHPETAQILEKLLTMLSEKGETVTFNYIKKWLKEK